MASNTLDMLDRELRGQAEEEAAQREQAVAELLEKTKEPFEAWESKNLINVLAVIGGVVFIGMGAAFLLGVLEMDDPTVAWACLGLGVLALVRGVSELRRRGPLLRFTEQALESNNCEPIPWDDIVDYELQDRSQNVLLLLTLKPGRAPRRTCLPPLLRLLKRRDGRFVIEGSNLRDWTWDTVMERMEEYRTAARLRNEK